MRNDHKSWKRQGYKSGGRTGFKAGDLAKGKFSKATLAAMKKKDVVGAGPHQTVEGKKAALQKLTQHLKKEKSSKK